MPLLRSRSPSLSWADEVEQADEPAPEIMPLALAVLHASKNRDNDKFNDRGVNVSAQKRRENLFPWILVDRSAKRKQDDLDDSMDVDDC